MTAHEHVMSPDLIAEAYDKLTHLWESADFDIQNGIAAHQKAINFVKTNKKSRSALNLGCGCSPRFTELLCAQGFNVEGVDLSRNMLSIAKGHHPDITFHHSDILTWQTSQHYDFITLWDVIWHIDMQLQSNLLKRIVSWLKPKGIFIFSFGGLNHPDEHIDNSMGPDLYYATLGTTAYIDIFESIGCQVLLSTIDQNNASHACLIIKKGDT